MDSARFFILIAEASSYIAAFAALAAAVIMSQITKKFGTGLLASGFKTIGSGVFFLALGIVIDTLNSYLHLSYDNIYSILLFVIKGACFVVGTYAIVIGTKSTADRLEKIIQG